MHRSVERVSDLLASRRMLLATAESCTGGMIAAALTARPGASDVFACGFVTYTDASKTALLGVPADLLALHGAVSAPVAQAMAEGTLRHSGADIAVSVTGIAGPGGATPSKPVGLVFIGVALRGEPAASFEHRFSGDRDCIRESSVRAALDHVADCLERECA